MNAPIHFSIFPKCSSGLCGSCLPQSQPYPLALPAALSFRPFSAPSHSTSFSLLLKPKSQLLTLNPAHTYSSSSFLGKHFTCLPSPHSQTRRLERNDYRSCLRCSAELPPGITLVFLSSLWGNRTCGALGTLSVQVNLAVLQVPP